MAETDLGIKLHEGIPSESEQEYFRNFKWCLNPILTFNELLTRLHEEINRFPSYTYGWQREESILNIYLFCSAISCTMSDYLMKPAWRIAPLAKRFPVLRPIILFVESALNKPWDALKQIKYRQLYSLLAEWDDILELASRYVISITRDKKNIQTGLIIPCDKGIRKLESLNLPNTLLRARMKLNEGFRCQDLSPFDVLTMADRFVKAFPDKESHIAVIGSRTAGSYLAPVLKVYMDSLGFRDVSWCTVRPKFGLNVIAKNSLRQCLKKADQVILVDDYANTGHTFHLLFDMVSSFGFEPAHIHMLAPVHSVLAARYPSQEDIDRLLMPEGGGCVFKLYQNDLYKYRSLHPASVKHLFKDFLKSEDVAKISVSDSPETRAINKDFECHYSDSFQVRVKRLFEIDILKNDGTTETRSILAKSVGVGWLGYHAFISGKIMHDYVPEVIGLRHGILFTNWINGKGLESDDISGSVLEHMASYLSMRTRELSLSEDPKGETPYLGWGWLEILGIFRKAYNNLLGYLKYGDLLSKLKRCISSPPVLVDGRMRPEEWILDPSGDYRDNRIKSVKYHPVKVDFEQHNFGAPELDVVDPAYDIASASFECQLSYENELKLADRYGSLSGDTSTLSERIFLYKLLYATTVYKRSLHRLGDLKESENRILLHQRLLHSWDFLVFNMNRFCASLIQRSPMHGKPAGILFMDIDGVFNSETLGFPHPSVSGLIAVSHLQSYNYKIIPNTGRSVGHVKNYCSSYGFEAGIGEYGSVIVDVIGNREISLVTPKIADELETCRLILRKQEGVYIDSGYRYAVRAFRYDDRGTRGLEKSKAESLLRKYGFKHLKIISREADTYFVGKDINKGAAVRYFMKYRKYENLPTMAVGDSYEDLAMLEEVTDGYMLRNCTDKIRRLAKMSNVTLVKHPAQRGLLDVASKITGHISGRTFNVKDAEESYLKNFDKRSFQHLMIRILSVAELPLYRKLHLLLV